MTALSLQSDASPGFGGFFPPWLVVVLVAAAVYVGWLVWQQRRDK